MTATKCTQIKRPRRWGHPTPAQFKLLADCVARGGSAYLAGHSMSTLNACHQRQWITIFPPTGKDSDYRADITNQGRACFALNSTVKGA